MRWWVGLILGLAATASVLFTLNDPGLTIDEPINVDQGKRIARTMLENPARFYFGTIDELWRNAHEHPPLARFLVGYSAVWLESEQAPLIPELGRPASAIAFGAIVFFITSWGWRFGGVIAGVSSGVFTLLLPRLFAQAHFASPEVISAAAIIPALMACGSVVDIDSASKRWRRFATVLCGLCIGIALLTKLTAILVPLTLTLILAGRFNRKDALLLVTVGVISLAVFIIGWPWLWPIDLDRFLKFPTFGVREDLITILAGAIPIAAVAYVLSLGFKSRSTDVFYSILVIAGIVIAFLMLIAMLILPSTDDFTEKNAGVSTTFHRLVEFFSVGVNRATIYVGYFGQQYPNANAGVPWHFVWVFFFATTPLVVHLFAIPGAMHLWKLGKTIPSARLPLAFVAVTLLFFTLPIHRYDGERLFLFVFPVYALIAGVGVGALWMKYSRPAARLAVASVFALGLAEPITQMIRLHPYQLSYYNLAVGGLKGANTLGLEATYWGDTLSREILEPLEKVAQPGDRVILTPCLYAGHAAYLTPPELVREGIFIEAGDMNDLTGVRWALVYNRGGYLIDPLPQKVLTEGRLAHEVARDGVWLSRLYELTPAVEAPPASPAENEN